MDKARPHPEYLILPAAMAAGRGMGLDWEVLEREIRAGQGRADARFRLRLGGHETDYLAEIRRGLRPATLGAVLHQMEAMGANLLVADYVTPPLADALRAHGVQFIDAAGNAYLNDPPLLVWVKGQKNPEEPFAREAMGRAFQPTGLQVLFTLLCKPELVGRPYRDLATQAGVAHGTVGWVMPELVRLGHVAEIHGKRRLLDAERLLNRWVEAYARALRPKTLLKRFQAETLDWTVDFDGGKYKLLLGGEPAAQVLTGYLRPGTATFYGERVEPRLVLDKRLRADVRGNVEIRRRFWRFDAEKPGLTPILLVYADLLAIGNARCLETAKELYGGIVNRLV